jgi:centromeric protein E
MQGSGSIQEGMAAGGNGGGIVHLAADDIFQHFKSDPSRIFRVRASFLEIYNEEVKDLLTENCDVLQIREDPRRGVFVQSKEEVVTDFESLLGVLFAGE